MPVTQHTSPSKRSGPEATGKGGSKVSLAPTREPHDLEAPGPAPPTVGRAQRLGHQPGAIAASLAPIRRAGASGAIQRLVIDQDGAGEVEELRVTLRHEPARDDGYNCRLQHFARFSDRPEHDHETLEFNQEVRSRHSFKEPGHARLTVREADWQDDGYNRAADANSYTGRDFNAQDLPGTNNMPAGATNIQFDFDSRQFIRTVGARNKRTLVEIQFPHITIQGPDLQNLVTTPADGTVESHVRQAPVLAGAFALDADF